MTPNFLVGEGPGFALFRMSPAHQSPIGRLTALSIFSTTG